MKYLLITLAMCTVIGCVWPMPKETDVTNDQNYWGGYKPGLKVMLVEDVYLQKKYNNLIPEKYFNNASSPKNLEFKWPKSFNEYLLSPGEFPEFSIVKKGTIIKCTTIYLVDNLSWSNIDVLGNIENGDYKNTSVNVRFLSDAANPNEGGLHLLKPDRQYLQVLSQ